MVFCSLTFLCVFLPVLFLLYYCIPSVTGRNILLIVSSLLFYAYGEPVYILLMIGSILLNYLFGRLLAAKSKRIKKIVLYLAVICNLGILGVFKYADMIVNAGNTLLHVKTELPGLALPIGISFFTFQAMSYVIDVYRGKAKAQKNVLHMMLYIALFPQLIAGPIVKYHDIEQQFQNRETDAKAIADGFRRFICGLAKKVLISNTMAAAADNIFQTPIGSINFIGAWIGAIAYMLQIYYDFSGYSDMAIGMGYMFGFHFQENFQYPYISRSVKEFWRRWHISLSTWFKEYLYIPLGGNRKGTFRTCINKLIVFFCTGLWHGANWTFVVWGMFHGFFLLLEELLPVRRLPKAVAHLYSLVVVCVGFVIFRADSITQGVAMIGKMFTGWEFGTVCMNVVWQQLTPAFLLMLAAGVIGCMPVKEYLIKWCREKGGFLPAVMHNGSYAVSILLLLLCMMTLSGGAYNPFIYFRF